MNTEVLPRTTLSIQTPIVNSLGQNLDPDIKTARQVSSGPRDLQDPVIGPGRKR